MGTPVHVPLLEREPQLAELLASIEAAAAGAGSLTIVEGPAGIGKSALLAQASDDARRLGARPLLARGSEVEREFAFGTVRTLFEPVLSAADLVRREILLAGAAAPATAVIDSEPSAQDRAASSEFAVLHAIYWLSTNLSIDEPLFIGVDDAHWVDDPSLRALSYLSRRLGELPIILVLAVRPDELGTSDALLDELRMQPGTNRIELQPLGFEAVSQIVRASVPDADESLCRSCDAMSGGNPFYLRELLLRIAAEKKPDDLEPLEVETLSIPSVGRLVNRRVSRLGAEAVDLATAMAILGDGGRLGDAAELAGLPPEEAATTAHALRRMTVLASEDPLEFAHPIVRRSIEGELPAHRADSLHLAAADLLRKRGAGAEAVAAHLLAAHPAQSPQVVADLREAARIATARAAPKAAVAYLRRAVAEGAPGEDSAALVSELGRAELLIRDPSAVATLQRALELETDGRQRGELVAALVEVLAFAGQWDVASAVIAQHQQDLETEDRSLLIEVEAIRAAICAYDSRLWPEFVRRRAAFEKAAREDGWAADAIALVLANMRAHRGGEPGAFTPVADEIVARGNLWQRDAGSWAAPQALGGYILVDELDRAMSLAGEILKRATEAGSVFGVLTAISHRAWTLCRRGELAAAELDLRQALSIANENGLQMAAVLSLYFCCEAIEERPGLEDVAALVDSIEPPPGLLSTMSGAWFVETRARLALLRSDRARAISDLRHSGEVMSDLGGTPLLSSWRSTLALALGPDARDEAFELAEEELRLSAGANPRHRAGALRARGLIEGGESGLASLREAASILEQTPARYEHARALADLGAALRRAKRRAEAREPLLAALDIAYRGGAERLAERVKEELAAAGARPRRPVRTGVEALTPSESRVARLAAGGRSNAEIAQELYVSLKTVEMHLSSAYRKLEVRSRGELPTALETPQAAV